MFPSHDPPEKLEAYERNILRDFATIKPYLPDTLVSVLDIGCSMGGIDILLAQYRDSIALINLIDGDGDAPKRGGYHETVEPWNSVDDAIFVCTKQYLLLCEGLYT